MHEVLHEVCTKFARSKNAITDTFATLNEQSYENASNDKKPNRKDAIERKIDASLNQKCKSKTHLKKFRVSKRSF